MSGIQAAKRSQSKRPSLGAHLATDVLGLWTKGKPDYRRIADLWKLSKADLSKLGNVAVSSVRFDENIPESVAERLRELANIANLMAEFFRSDAYKVGLWLELLNPMLGNVSPRAMIRAGRYRRLLNFVLESREAETAAQNAKRGH